LDIFNKGLLGNEQQIEFTASEEVWGVLKDLGRTEDVKFSPNNRRLAVAGFAKNKLVVLDVEIAVSAAGKGVALTDFMEIRSSSLHAPHGLCFIDDTTLIVANRGGEAPILRLPPSGTVDKKIELSALQTIRRDPFHQLKSPGSVSVSQIDQNLYEVLICNNYVHYVTRHILEGREPFALKGNEILLSKGLSIPDGVAVNKERRWIAISNHNTHSVFLYENTPRLNGQSEPDGILRNVNYPHGVRFTPDDNFVLVADAGSPYVNIYAKDGDSWNGTRDPVTTFRVMDEMTYRRGRSHPSEGGPKGIDIDSDMNVLVTTCDQQTLAFFDLPEILKKREIPMDWRKKSFQWRVERIRDDLRRRRGWK
jgi:DNA-binding beta-propeller fold protein YncE